MKTFFLLTPLFFLSGCVIISISLSKPIPLDEITAIEANAVQDFQLKVTTQTDNLRIDIIRQTETETDCDGDSDTVDVDYHPIGFDLGNGLFFDLNNNLSFRIDSLLDLQSREDFELRRTVYRMEQNIVREDNQMYTRRFLSSGREREFHMGFVEYTTKGLRYFSRKKLRYEFTQEEEKATLSYTNLRSRSIDIFTGSTNDFFIKRRKQEEHFTLEDNKINLRDLYLIERNAENDVIEIYAIGRKANYLRFQIKIDADKIIIYNKNNFGTKIDYSPTNISISHNDSEYVSSSFERLK